MNTVSSRLSVISLLAPLFGIMGVLAAWQLVVSWLEVPRYLLPAPTDIATIVVARISDLVAESVVTVGEAMAGFLIGSSAAFCVGAAFAQVLRIERALAPVFVALQAVPLVAIAPLLIVWMGNGFASKVTMAAMICFFPMVITTAAGLRSAPRDSEELMTALDASAWQRFALLRLPRSVPFLTAGLKVNASYAVIGAIVSELAGAGRGIGYLILMASYKTDTPMLFAAIFMAAASGIAFFKLIEAIGERLNRRFGA